MESSQTPPPGGSATPPPGGEPPHPAPPPPSGPRDDGRANVGLRIGAVVLALALAIICAVAVLVMVDVNDTKLCEDVNRAEVTGVYECYDFSGSIKPVVVGAGWIGAVLAGIAILNGISEWISFSRVIDGLPPLRLLDRAGRRAA